MKCPLSKFKVKASSSPWRWESVKRAAFSKVAQPPSFPPPFAAYPVWAVSHAEGAVQMLVYSHPATGQSVPPRRLFDLQHAMSDLHGVVPIHHTLMLQSKNALHILASQWQKSAAGLRRRNGKTPVELRDVLFAQKTIGVFHRADPPQAQLLRQPPLPGAKVPLTAAARLRGVGRDHANP